MSLEQKEIFENSNKHSFRIDYLNGLEFRHSSTLRDSRNNGDPHASPLSGSEAASAQCAPPEREANST